MKSSLITITAMTALLSAASCSNSFNIGTGFKSDPSSPIVSRTVNPGSFSEIFSAQGLKVVYQTGSESSVVIKAPQDLQDKIKVENRQGDLNVKLSQQVAKGIDRVVVTVTSPMVSGFHASSASTLSLPDGYDLEKGTLILDVSSGAMIIGRQAVAPEIEITASSGGSLTLSSESEEIEVSASSGAAINVSGKSAKGEINASSGATVSAQKLEIASGSASASSGALIVCDIIRPESITSSSGGSINNSRH